MPGWDGTLVYQSNPQCIGDRQTITIDFKFPVSHVFLRVGIGNPQNGPVLTIADDRGYATKLPPSWTFGSYEGTLIMPSENVRRVTLTMDSWDRWSGSAFYVDDISFSSTTAISVVDPFPELLEGYGVLSESEPLATMGTPVTAIAAERAGRVVLRVKANFSGERLTLSVLNDQGQPSNASSEDGYVGTIPTNASPGTGTMQVTAVKTSVGPMAFAMYRPPTDFSRAGRDDGEAERLITLKVESLDTPGATSTITVRILRPPVVLVHGLWGEPGNWQSFKPLVADSRFYVRYSKYDYALSGLVTSSVPAYQQWVLARAKSNALGFAYNAKLVYRDMESFLNDYRRTKGAAVSQVDVVAHSMGGVVTRTIENLPEYRTKSYGAGVINKLITIGTPHLGSPIATQMMQDANSCIRGGPGDQAEYLAG